ncbi:MFS transporter [Pseudonocardia broussonetiae]|uniref:Putative proline/betaine transporter n=1 Tax=Pseudonocardia broussonetiae TaxID=2736640 RepID=A0A6M6JIV6_9PSEU|nr:MFS transporter [Pseudonocardia broussonetiae]QJY48014.1 MHS family MFS transporter [Pseudonocardia broussonetiae]
MSAPARNRPPTKVVAASTAGTVVEWYDFFIYATAATLVFPALFFPQAGSQLAGILAALGTYAVGFVARPVGGIVFGHYGDKLGRKQLLQISLLIIGVATFLIGLLPTYGQVGVWAPILLVVLRFAQGFALGGEWGGAVLLVSEHGSRESRGLWASFPQAAVPAGNILATGVLALLSVTLTQEAFLSWGWRIAFLASAVLVVIGYVIRTRIEDAPVFRETIAKVAAEEQEHAPLREVLREYPRQLLVAMGLRISENTQYYMVVSFSITYLTVVVGVPSGQILGLLLVAHVVHLFAVPFAGFLSDRVGRKPVIGFGIGLAAVWGVVAWQVFETNQRLAITVVLVGGLLAHACMYGPQAAFLSEMFPTRMRYTGISVGHQVASILAGALAPILAGILLAVYGNWFGIAAYLVVAASISAVALYHSRETRGLDYAELDRRTGHGADVPSVAGRPVS